MFVEHVTPGNVLYVFWKYDQHVLVRKDIEKVQAVTNNSGNTAGAEKLLELLCKYENWVPCLIQVLQDDDVKQYSVANKLQEIINEIKSDPGSGYKTKSLAEKDSEINRLRAELEELKLKQKSLDDKEKEKDAIIENLTKALEQEKQRNSNSLENREADNQCEEKQMKIDKLEKKLEIMVNGLMKNFTESSDMGSLMLIFAESKEFRPVRELIEDKGIDINKTNTDGRNVLMFAAEDGNLESVDWFINHGADTKMKDNKEWTVLSHAAVSGSSDCVQALLGTGCCEYINTSVVGGCTPLMLAAKSRTDGFQCVQKLIGAGADIDAVDVCGCTALAHSAIVGNFGCLQVLLDAGRHLVNKPKNDGKTPLMLASGSDEKYITCMQKLVDAGASINMIDNYGFTPLACATIAENVDCIEFLLQISRNKQINVANLIGVTPLMLASTHHTDNTCLRKLLSAGADIGMKDENGHTALARAAKHGKTACVQALLEAGTDGLVNVPTNDGQTPLILASLSGDGSNLCLQELLRAGADINKKDNGGHTALAKAASRGKTACVQALLQIGNDILVNIPNIFGQTPLILAALSSDECMQELLEAGADINMKDNGGHTALAKAASHGKTASVQALLNAGGDKLVNIPNAFDQTPLILAASSINDNDMCMQELLKAGADINMKDKDGHTALYYASLRGNVKCVQILQNASSQHLI